MESRKGQSQVVTAVLLVLIMITLVGVTYFWGIPLIQKQKDVVTVSNMERFLKTLNNKIQLVAKNGGTQKVTGIDVPGELELKEEEDKFVLNFKTTGHIIATGKDIYLVGDKRKETYIGEESGVILVRSEKIDGKYDVTASLYYRNLTGSVVDGKENKYIIDLIGLGRGSLSGSGREITIREEKTKIKETSGERHHISRIYIRME